MTKAAVWDILVSMRSHMGAQVRLRILSVYGLLIAASYRLF
jgi:hypothetical protein